MSASLSGNAFNEIQTESSVANVLSIKSSAIENSSKTNLILFSSSLALPG